MDIHDSDISGRNRRISFVWCDQFVTPRPSGCVTRRKDSTTPPNESWTKEFLYSENDVLNPPCFNWYPLESFMKSSTNSIGTIKEGSSYLSSLGLLEEHTLSQHHIDSDACLSCDGSNTATQSVEQTDSTMDRQVLNEKEMIHHLRRNPYHTDANRRIIFITNVTPLCSSALYDTPKRHFIQSHIAGEIRFSASVQNATSLLCNSPKRYRQLGYNFTIMFNLSYVALRPGSMNSDPRNLRQTYSMIKPIQSAFDDLYYHDAQISFLMTGKNEWQWTAYCFVDTFFGGEQTAEEYIHKHQDAPSGGARDSSETCWDPREYFLLVLSQRFLQVSREWGNFFTVLMSRLDSYESFYIRTIDTNDLCDDESLTRTNSYTKAVSIGRQSHDTLSTTLETLHNFLVDTEKFFEKKDPSGSISDEWRGYFAIIQQETDHLEMWKRRVHQRMQRFQAMKDGLVSYSALEESRRTTRQGSDIGILTNMTVAYLPFNLAAALFSISSATPPGHIWLYWAVVSSILGVATFYFAFGNRVVRSWARWRSKDGKQAAV